MLRVRVVMLKNLHSLALMVAAITFCACSTAPGVAPVPGESAPDGGPPSPPPLEFASCVGLPHDCGPNGDADCCPSLTVPAMFYRRSFDVAADLDFSNATFPAVVSAFRLDKYEVTVGRFRAFVRAGMGTQAAPPAAGSGAHAAIAGSGWNPAWSASLPASTSALVTSLKSDPALATWTDEPGPGDGRPINDVSWFEAMAFCIWDGGYLPTEAEWNGAATGGDEQRAYPWSVPAGSTDIGAAQADFFDGNDCLGDGQVGCDLHDYRGVGSKPAGDGRWGHSDLAGGVQEWVLDVPQVYASPCSDCASLGSAVPNQRREVRGGSSMDNPDDLRTAHRLSVYAATEHNALVGFRCARPL